VYCARRLQEAVILPVGWSANSSLSLVGCRHFPETCLFRRASWILCSMHFFSIGVMIELWNIAPNTTNVGLHTSALFFHYEEYRVFFTCKKKRKNLSLCLTNWTLHHEDVWDYYYYYYYYYYYGSTALCWALAAFSVSRFYTQSVGLLKRGISPLQGLYLNTEQHKHRINAHNTDIHALSGIRNHDPRVRASEDSSCLRPRVTMIGRRMGCLN
jgi:hypothetical protein